MGLVYRGAHEVSGAAAAIKTVRVREAGRISQIRREIQALARLRHPGLVRVLSHGVDEGRPWYAMELLEGRTLSEVAARPEAERQRLDQSAIHVRLDRSDAVRAWAARPTPPEQLGLLLGAIHDLCETLAYVHGEGVIHRDLKPSNVLVMPSGTPVLVDFGLAAHIGDTSGREVLDAETAPAGSAHYMSPEQIRGEPLDPRCDLYAVGCMLFEFVTGQPAFVGSLESVIDQHLRRPPPKLSEFVEGFPSELEPLVAGLLEKDRRQRIGHARDVAAVLRTCGVRPAAWPPPLPPVRTYLYRPPLIGRREILDQLDEQLQRLAAGNGSIAFVDGESGVGKTRLALEVAKHAEHRGIRVIASGCLDMSAGERRDVGAQSAPLEPLRPFLRCLADACAERGEAEAAQLLGAAGPVLAAFEPALAERTQAKVDAPLGVLPARAALNRLYESLREVLVAFAAGGPLLLIIDDLQWADELTLGVLEYLGAAFARGPDAPLMVLGLLRREECSPRLRAAVQAPWARRFELPRLASHELGHMVAGMLSITRPPAAFIEYLSKQSEGNPFFVAEYLRTAVAEQLLVRDASGQWQLAQTSEPTEVMCAALPLPHSLREVVERRVGGLDPIVRRIMVVAGTIGREFELSLLQAAASVGEEEAIDAIAELVQRQVLEPTPAGPGFRFAHDKLRQIPIGELAHHERQALHRRVAEVLETRQLRESEAELAAVGHHWLEAGVPERAAPHLHKAGDLAMGVHALDRAIAHYQRALAGHSPDTAQLTEKLADVLSLRGSFAEARSLFERALALAERDPGLSRARLRGKLGKTWELEHVHERALAEYDTAEAELRRVSIHAESWRHQWIQIQLSRVWVYYWCVRVGDMNRVLEDIAPELTQHGTALERAQYFSALAQRDLRLHSYVVDDALIANLEHSRQAAREANAPVEMAMAGFLLGFARLFQGELALAEGELLETLRAARKLGDATIEIRCIAYLALIYRRANDVQRADALARETLARASVARMGEYVGLAQACLAWTRYRAGQFSEAEELCHQALGAWSKLSFPYPFEWSAALILLALERGDASTQAVALARKLCGERSARLPDAIHTALENAVQAAELPDATRVQSGLHNAVAAALELGYI
jgi:serine/threonine protein kinase